jgi:hypothetical protein
MFEGVQKQLLRRLLADTALQQRVERLSSIDGVGEITALTWALEVGDPHRFASIAEAVSYCGLTAALRSSAGKQQRGPISKQRNAWLQTALIEAAKLAPRWNPQLAQLYGEQLRRGQERPAFSGAYAAAKKHPNEEKSQKRSRLGGLVAGSRLVWVCAVSGPPAGPHVCRDCAREFALPIHPIVCFEVGWFTLTQSSRTKLHRSRKWMSGHAATALVTRRIEDSFKPYPALRLGKAIPPSQGKSPFSLDGYLSWMSRNLPTKPSS